MLQKVNNQLQSKNDEIKKEESPPNMFESKHNIKYQLQPRRFTGYCTSSMRNRWYGYLIVDETRETVFVYQQDLPFDCFTLYKGDRFEFGMFCIEFVSNLIN